jgi:hypothetical protein
LLEEIRLLANTETPQEKLLPLVLAGQPELADRLEESGLRQLKQRVALRCAIEPLDLSETAAYIASRIRTAGGVPSKLFTREGVSLIHEHSGGIPRTISVICDNALVTGMALDRRPVDRAIVLEVCRDFQLRRQPPTAVPEYAQSDNGDDSARPDLELRSSEPEGGGPILTDAPKPRRFNLFGSRR